MALTLPLNFIISLRPDYTIKLSVSAKQSTCHQLQSCTDCTMFGGLSVVQETILFSKPHSEIMFFTSFEMFSEESVLKLTTRK